MTRFVFIGGGVAAATAVRELRSLGFYGQITLVTDEADLPYERPPLSKEWLTGEMERPQFRINPAEWYAENGVDVLLNTRARKIDVAGRQVLLADGGALPYGALVLATGARARTLSGFGGDRVHVLRSLADSERLSERLVPGRHLVVLGAGFTGCEVAALAVTKGLRVTVFNPGLLPLAALSPTIGSELLHIHIERGVDMRMGESVVKMTETESGIELITDRGELVHCDDMLVAVGSVPNVELALDAGIDVDGGIVTDEYGRTSAPDVYAIGDVAARFHSAHGRRFRIEHHDTAMRHGTNVARNLIGRAEPFEEGHFFWSHQYENNLQSFGHACEGGVQVMRGSLTNRTFSLFTLKDGRIRSVVSLNRPQDVMQTRKLLGIDHTITEEQLADVGFELKSLLPRAAAPRRREDHK